MTELNLHFVLQEDWNKEVSERIKQFRKQRKLTQSELAKAIGISYQNLGHYENGIRKVPINLLPLLANSLETSLEELLGLEEKAKRRGPPSQLERRFEKIKDLSKKDQTFIIEMLDRVLDKAS